MEWWALLLVGMFILLSLFMSGLAIFLCFLLINVAGVLLTFGPAGFGLFANSIFETTNSESLTAIALFIVMGEFLFRSGAIDVAFRSCDTLIGKVRGRQYYLSISLTTFIGALAGSAMGMAAMLGRSLYPAMVSRGYDSKLTIGTILGGASLAPIIPPSVLVIIIGALANVSISALLIAGIIPGFLLSALFLGYVVVRIKLNPALSPDNDSAPARKATARDKWIAVWELTPINLILAVVMGFLMAGICTPSESAALGVAGAILTAWY
ncbi:MAG TPA: TRAP transporter large permease subunit, partial [Alphaproteobacteria bacterium]